jgi:hypothetical protein
MVSIVRWNPGQSCGRQRGRSCQDKERHCHGECQGSLSGEASHVASSIYLVTNTVKKLSEFHFLGVYPRRAQGK